MFRTSTVPRSATLWMIKRPAFLLLDAGMEAVDADAVLEASVPVVSHPERVAQASATINRTTAGPVAILHTRNGESIKIAG